MPRLHDFQVRQLVRKNRPLGVVLRDLILSGLETEKQEASAARKGRSVRTLQAASLPSPTPLESS